MSVEPPRACATEAVPSFVLFYFLSTCFSQSTPFVHSMKVLSWQFLLFDVEELWLCVYSLECVCVCVGGQYGILTVCEGCRGGGRAASGLGLALGGVVDRQTRRMERKGLGLATEV